MCGRFYIDPDDMTDAELIALLDREKAKAEAQDETSRLTFGEVRPGDRTIAIAMNRKLQRSAFAMDWGFHLEKRLIFNARSETAADKPLFRPSVKERRCLIPASAYFEWDHRIKPLQKYRFQLHEQQKIYLAGLYRFEPEQPVPVFTILTRDAAPDIACFHDRMPVIIPADMTDAWLDRTQSFDELLYNAVTQVIWNKAS